MIKRLLCVLLIFLLLPIRAEASNDAYYDESAMLKSRATAYCLDGVTASGQEVRKGVCAGKDEWLGY